MAATPSAAVVMTGATAAVQRVRRAARGQLRLWLPVVLFTVMIGAQTLARTGDFGGFVDSTKPVRIPGQTFTTADGYVIFWDGIPVNGDATSFLDMTKFMQDQRGSEGTGIYDRRAGYSYLGALASLLMGHYQSFVSLNALAWLGAALAMYWLGGRLLGSRLAAWTAGTLTATGQGFSFMVGTPVSTLLGFASVALVLAFVEWTGLLRPPFRWRDWLHTGWLIAAVSLIYPVYLALLAFTWLYGLRRVPLTRLLGLSVLVLGLAQVWPLIGATVVGLAFDTTNSALLAEALNRWWSAFSLGLHDFLGRIRTVATAGTIYAAFPGGMLLAAAYGYVVAGKRVRRWALALCLATLLASAVFTIVFAIPRTAFFAYPAIYLLAAAGLNQVIQAMANWCPLDRGSAQVRGALSAAVIMLGLLLLVAPSVVALVGYGGVDASFHYWTPTWVLEAAG